MNDPANLLLPGSKHGIPLIFVTADRWSEERAKLPAEARAWADANAFQAQAGRHLSIPGKRNSLSMVIAGLAKAPEIDPFVAAGFCRALPKGTYSLEGGSENAFLIALGWCLEAYGFDRYGKKFQEVAKLVCPATVDRDDVLRISRAVYLVRDLVNTPASDMGPDELQSAAGRVAAAHKAKLKVTRGTALARDFPMIHAVGQASPRAPRLLDFSWGPARGPKITLVGKGVCFDTGGLDIKPASGMLLMKKDMGGAANVLGLASMIMSAKLPVRLRVLIPAVENSIAGDAFRPGDVLKSRKGLSVEIGNTDAEGRLILADALSLADDEKPELLIDMATLTGAARVALGPDLPPFFTDDEELSADLMKAGAAQRDPVWRLPFWEPYNRLFESAIADMNNSGDSGYAGAITAALFLKRFTSQAKSYVHFDVFAWTPASRPGYPKGGEAQAIRALFDVIRKRYSK